MGCSLPVRLAVVGGGRGGAFNGVADAMPDRLQVSAVCDSDEAVLDRWRTSRPSIRTFARYEDMLGEADADAVYVATPPDLHAQQSMLALGAGKHVLSEVFAATTVEECWALVESAKQAPGLVYMMAENDCYTRPNMMVLNMVRCGLFGEATYAEGGYLHDCRSIILDERGELTWRGLLYSDAHGGNWYPTHSLGPVAQWLGMGRTDAFDSAATFATRAEGAWRYVSERLGAGHPLASPRAMAGPDSVTTVIATRRGCVVVLRLDVASSRPHNTVHYALQGTRGSYLSERWAGESPLVWIDGLSHGHSPAGTAEWQALWELAGEYEHPLWRESGHQAEAGSHDGADCLTILDFVKAVSEGTAPPIDVYDAAEWSAVVDLSRQSVRQGGSPVPFPRFRPEPTPTGNPPQLRLH